MKALIVSLCLAAIGPSLIAQKPPLKFGDVSKEEILMTTYDKDSTASAVILADYGVSEMLYRQNQGFLLDFERTTRIKILTKEGLSWGNLTVSLYKSGSNDEKLVGLKATTYNWEDGKVVESKVKNDGIFRENHDANWDLVKLTCPNVKEGSVVEITYKISSPFVFNFQDWAFQSSIPTLISEYRARIPEYFNYDKYMQGYTSLNVADETRHPNKIRLTSMERTEGRITQSKATMEEIDYQEVRYRWVANEVPAFIPEPYMTSVNDYITKINFELSSVKYPNKPIEQIMGSWSDINKTMAESENFGVQITTNGFLKKIVEEITAATSSEEEKINAITNYVKANVHWDGNQRKFISRPLRKVLDDKKGNSADINLLLGSMLEKAGIQVSPVLLSTRDNGLLRMGAPIVSQFNYVICLAQANGKTYLLDATDRLLPIDILPERCLNGQGFAVSKQGFTWVPLVSKKTREVTSGEFLLKESGEMEGKLKYDCSGYAALESRKKFLLDGEEAYMKDFIGSHSWDVTSSSFINAKEIQNNFSQEHELVVSENMVVAGNVIYIDPFVHSSYKENPFKSEVREYPVDFGSPREQTLFFRLTLPDNYTVDELPQTKVMSMPENGARYTYSIVVNGNQLAVTSMLQINKGLFTQLEYPYLREFYNQVVAKQAEQIVLKRK
ncbi:MAG TPA: transglutaminase domain-containing protein [Chryseosolibacter sp.]